MARSHFWKGIGVVSVMAVAASPAWGLRLGVDVAEGARGLRVDEVFPATLAARMGIRPGSFVSFIEVSYRTENGGESTDATSFPPKVAELHRVFEHQAITRIEVQWRSNGIEHQATASLQDRSSHPGELRPEDYAITHTTVGTSEERARSPGRQSSLGQPDARGLGSERWGNSNSLGQGRFGQGSAEREPQPWGRDWESASRQDTAEQRSDERGVPSDARGQEGFGTSSALDRSDSEQARELREANRRGTSGAGSYDYYGYGTGDDRGSMYRQRVPDRDSYPNDAFGQGAYSRRDRQGTYHPDAFTPYRWDDGRGQQEPHQWSQYNYNPNAFSHGEWRETAPREQADAAEWGNVPARDAAGNYLIQVFYGTDRRNEAPEGALRPAYGTGRGNLAFGTCTVSIPRDHRLGVLESPMLIKFEFRPNPDRHVVLLQTSELPAGGFFQQLRDCVARSERKEALVFVHGYNVTFEDAARRTAQLAYDLNLVGAPIFYSWPSQGSLVGYLRDEANALWAVADLKEFLAQVAAQSGATSIYVIAHSMGNRCLTEALRLMANEPSGVPDCLKEIVLAAPDIDADTFRVQVYPAIKGARSRLTVYASSRDEALRAAQELFAHPRLGQSDQPVVLPPIETVDASAVDTSLIGHSYYGDGVSVIADMYYLLRDHLPAARRFGMRSKGSPAGVYWQFLPR